MPKNLTDHICDDTLFSKAFKTYAEDLYHFLYYKFGNRLNPRDKVQEAFIKLWENCKEVPPSKAKSFVFTVANNLMLNEVAHQKVVLEYQKNDLKLNDNVTFIDRVPYKKVLEMMQQAHIILLPSVEEGIANVILEGMMLKKIVLTTNCGGMEEVITDGINGFVVPTRDPRAIADKIIEISK